MSGAQSNAHTTRGFAGMDLFLNRALLPGYKSITFFWQE